MSVEIELRGHKVVLEELSDIKSGSGRAADDRDQGRGNGDGGTTSQRANNRRADTARG